MIRYETHFVPQHYNYNLGMQVPDSWVVSVYFPDGETTRYPIGQTAEDIKRVVEAEYPGAVEVKDANA